MNATLLSSVMVPDTAIFDLLNIKSENIDRALRVLEYSSSENDVERVLFKQKEKKVYVFDRIEIQKNKINNKAMVCLRKKGASTNLLKVKSLIDKLYKLYGEDDLSKKRFALNDLLDANHGKEVCREWEHTSYPVNISYTKDKIIEMKIDLD